MFKLKNGKTYKYASIRKIRDELFEIYGLHSPSLVKAIEKLYESKIIYLMVDRARII